MGSLGDPIALHAPPFHFVMGEDGPEPCDPKLSRAKKAGEQAKEETIKKATKAADEAG